MRSFANNWRISVSEKPIFNTELHLVMKTEGIFIMYKE